MAKIEGFLAVGKIVDRNGLVLYDPKGKTLEEKFPQAGTGKDQQARIQRLAQDREKLVDDEEYWLLVNAYIELFSLQPEKREGSEQERIVDEMAARIAARTGLDVKFVKQDAQRLDE